jgi:hypothetical protein
VSDNWITPAHLRDVRRNPAAERHNAEVQRQMMRSATDGGGVVGAVLAVVVAVSVCIAGMAACTAAAVVASM